MHFQSKADSMDVIVIGAHIDLLNTGEGCINSVHLHQRVSVALESGLSQELFLRDIGLLELLVEALDA